jgi:hypothetical protein
LGENVQQQFLSIGDMLKATPFEEGEDRFVFIEASNEALDQQGEVVLTKALADSADYFLRYGNLDIDHITQIGAKAGIADYELFEIGRPVDVKIDGRRTLVKGQVYCGEGPVAERANRFWDSLTKLNPPQRWYPSVGGQVLAPKMTVIDPQTNAKKAVVTQVRWTNIGFSKTPVNQMVPVASTIPFGAFAKCWSAAGFDLGKALEAGYGTDAAALTGGAALRRQSLHGSPINYWDWRDALSAALVKKEISDPTAARLLEFSVSRMGVSRNQSAEWVERFLRDLSRHLKSKRNPETRHVRKAA